MSKGPGTAQQRILKELEARPAFYLDELAKTRSERVSLNRAAWKLYKTGKLDIKSFATGRQKVVVMRCGFEFDRLKYLWGKYDWQQLPQLPKVISVE